MKKIFLTTLAVATSVALVGCGANANESAINSLSTQLDQTSNIVSKVQMINPSSMAISKSSLEKMATLSQDDLAETQQILLSEEGYKTEILSRTAKLKNCLDKNIKLSKAQTTAVKELTSALGRYTNSISYSQSELDSTAKSIASMAKNAEKNEAKINSKLNRLVCNSNSRTAYYQNILTILDELGCYLECDCEQAETPTETESEKKQTSVKTLKNIDTYQSKKAENEETEEPIDPEFSQPPIRRRFKHIQGYNADTYGPMARNIDTFRPYGFYGNNFYGNNGYGMYNNGMHGNAYGMYGNAGMNPYGNRFYGNARGFENGMNGMYYGQLPSNDINRLAYQTNAPEQRLEDFEECDENGTIRKQTPNEDLRIKEVSEIETTTDKSNKIEKINNLENKNFEIAKNYKKSTEVNEDEQKNSQSDKPTTLELRKDNMKKITNIDEIKNKNLDSKKDNSKPEFKRIKNEDSQPIRDTKNIKADFKRVHNDENAKTDLKPEFKRLKNEQSVNDLKTIQTFSKDEPKVIKH